MELLFWKTNKEEIEMVEGYGSYQSKGKQAWSEDAEILSRAGPWREEDELELRELYEKHREADDPVGGILSEMCKRCSRPKIMEKLLAMGLVGDRKELYKKRAGKSGARSRRKGCNSDDSGDDDEDVGVPLVPLTEENETAMEDEVFLDFLKRLGIAPPANEQLTCPSVKSSSSDDEDAGNRWEPIQKESP
ncbi:hypothetical protein DPMN_077525 [Dreissena polymorpha]|uniref:Timeless C-terminal domain-containing protein n=1 Tax=Dreissena polymorpha TaxID=45954 RepID=A0A9D3YKM9_DREPO|nr:hypothetical protein DPMN_077525 [Dreissena polymorpha]